MRRPLIVVGYPRSGTTLLRSVLGQHSRITLVNEPELIYALYHAGYDVGSRFPPGSREGLLAQLRQVDLCRRHLDELPRQVLAGFISAPEVLTFRDVYERLLPLPGGTDLVWGEKSINNIFFLDALERIYPEALFVHIVRDARAAVSSKSRKKRAADGDVKSWMPRAGFFAQQAALWAEYVSIGRLAAGRLSDGRWVAIHYEEFVAQPHVCLERICNAVGLDFEPRMLDAELRRADPALLRPDGSTVHKRLASEFDTSRVRSFAGEPAPLIWVVEKYAGDALRSEGYELTRPDLTLPQRLLLRLVAPTPDSVRRFLAGWREKRHPARAP
jgi:hypothetical protein